jgi:hypothetical protein
VREDESKIIHKSSLREMQDREKEGDIAGDLQESPPQAETGIKPEVEVG